MCNVIFDKKKVIEKFLFYLFEIKKNNFKKSSFSMASPIWHLNSDIQETHKEMK